MSEKVASMATSLEDIDRRSLFHPWTSIAEHAKNGPLVIQSGQGARLRDNQGRESIDGLAGLWCVDIGYGRTEVADAIAAHRANGSQIIG